MDYTEHLWICELLKRDTPHDYSEEEERFQHRAGFRFILYDDDEIGEDIED